MKKLKEVDWRRFNSYLRKETEVIENNRLLLIRKNRRIQLIYDVYLKHGYKREWIGTCHILEQKKHRKRKCPCETISPCMIVGNGTCPYSGVEEKMEKNEKLVVVLSKSPKLKRRLKDVQQIIRESL